MFRTDNCGRSVIFFKCFIDNQIAITEVLCHRASRIWSWMLNVWPVYIAAREFQIGFDRFTSVVGISNDQTTDDVHLVSMDVIDGFNRGVAFLTVFALCVLRNGTQKREI